MENQEPAPKYFMAEAVDRETGCFAFPHFGLAPAPWGGLGARLHLHGNGTCSLSQIRLPWRPAAFASAFCWLVLCLKILSGQGQRPSVPAQGPNVLGILQSGVWRVPFHILSAPLLQSESSKSPSGADKPSLNSGPRRGTPVVLSDTEPRPHPHSHSTRSFFREVCSRVGSDLPFSLVNHSIFCNTFSPS